MDYIFQFRLFSCSILFRVKSKYERKPRAVSRKKMSDFCESGTYGLITLVVFVLLKLYNNKASNLTGKAGSLDT